MKIVFALVACLWASVCLGADPADVEKKRGDAAIQVREGDVNQWIEYYKNQNKPVTQKPTGDTSAGQSPEKGAPNTSPVIAPDEGEQK
jgi:hypothetical protein